MKRGNRPDLHSDCRVDSHLYGSPGILFYLLVLVAIFPRFFFGLLADIGKHISVLYEQIGLTIHEWLRQILS